MYLPHLSSYLLIAIFLTLLFQDVNYQQCYKRGGISSGPRANSRGRANISGLIRAWALQLGCYWEQCEKQNTVTHLTDWAWCKLTKLRWRLKCSSYTALHSRRFNFTVLSLESSCQSSDTTVPYWTSQIAWLGKHTQGGSLCSGKKHWAFLLNCVVSPDSG